MRTRVFGALSLVLLCAVATAEPPQPTAAPVSNSLPSVTVEAQREATAEQARQFVGKVSSSSWATAVDHPLELWRRPVCLAVSGLPRSQGELVYKRFTEIVTQAGATLGKNGCTPNLIVAVTTEPQVFLSAWRQRDKRLFGAANPGQVKQFLTSALPVRVWYNTGFAGEDADEGGPSNSLSSAAAGAGAVGGMGESGGASSSTQGQIMLSEIPTFQEQPGGTRLSLTAVPDLSSAIVVVDLKKCQGIGWGALTDYVAMASLSNVDLDTNFGDIPSVLTLFGAPGEKRQTGLTNWDRAYLKALYHSRRMSRLQRVEIREQMVREMDATAAKAQ